MAEVLWEPVRDFQNYIVSNTGLVVNARSERELTPRPSGWGYLQIVLPVDGRQKTLSVHRLVAQAFVPGEDVGLEVNHIDGVKTNNNDWNLEWVTKSMNNQHAFDTGLRKARGRRIRLVETGEEFRSISDCARQMNLHASGVWAVANGRANHYKGWRFEYV